VGEIREGRREERRGKDEGKRGDDGRME